MKKLLLGAGLCLLASCGSPTTSAPTPTPTTPITITDAPSDATASREFLFSQKQAKAVMQSLDLHELDTVDLGNRLRVVLSVVKGQSGASAGQKKASVTFIWGNQTVNLSGSYILGLGPVDSAGTLKTANGKLSLAVKSPDFQAKTSKNTPFNADTSLMCAHLTFNLSAGSVTWSSNTPIEVCEGVSERETEKTVLEKLSSGLLYREGVGAAPWKFVRLSDQQPAPNTWPSNVDILTALQLPLNSPVTTQVFDGFFYPLVSEFLPPRESETLPKVERMRYKAIYKKYVAFYNGVQVYRIRLSSEKDAVLVLGRNSYGFAGLLTYGFHDSNGSSDPQYTYPSVYRYGGSVVGTVQVGPHDPNAVITGKYALRSSTICAPGVNVTLDKDLLFDFMFPPAQGRASTQFTIEAVPDTGQDVVMDYAVTVSFAGQTNTYKGYACDILTPPPVVVPSVNDVKVWPYFGHNSQGDPVSAAILSLEGFDGPTPNWNSYPGSMTISGTYQLRNTPECGAADTVVLNSGALDFTAFDAAEFYLYDLHVPAAALAGIGPTSQLLYHVSMTGKDGPRVVDGAVCVDWQP